MDNDPRSDCSDTNRLSLPSLSYHITYLLHNATQLVHIQLGQEHETNDAGVTNKHKHTMYAQTGTDNNNDKYK